MINLPNNYKLKMISYRAKNIVRGIIGKRGERKRARILSYFAVLAIIALVSSLSVYGFNLKSGAEGNTNISATGAINNNYNYNYQGISIHTKAETLNPNKSGRGDATVKKGGTGTPAVLDIVQFTLTISNADTTPRTVDVKFTLPTGFTYRNGSAKNDGDDLVDPTTITNGVMLWSSFSAKPGDTLITFNTNGPT